jgi:predicted DNA-binding transcriptional regulator YafY
MARGDQLSRVLRLMTLLEGKVGRTLDQLRAELNVTKRTIQRDLEALEAAGLPIMSETRNGTVRWHFFEGFATRCNVSLTLPELMALYLSKGLCKPLQATSLYESLLSAFNKVGAAIPAPGLNFLNSLENGISVTSFGWKDYGKSKASLQQLTKAVFHHQTVELAYTASGHSKPLTRKVDPYRLWYVNNGLYLVGLDHRKEDIRVYAVERIGTITLTNHRFEVPSDFVFEEFTKTAFQMMWGDPQTVRIRFSPDQAPFVAERTWHPSQKITNEEDGSLVLELSVGNLWEVKRWLIGWGASAQVLGPPELRQDILDECRSLLNDKG